MKAYHCSARLEVVLPMLMSDWMSKTGNEGFLSLFSVHPQPSSFQAQQSYLHLYSISLHPDSDVSTQAQHVINYMHTFFVSGFTWHVRLKCAFILASLGISRRRATLLHKLKQCQLLSADVRPCTTMPSMNAPL